MRKKQYRQITSLKGLLIMIIVFAHAKGFFQIEYIPGLRFIVDHMLDYANFFFFLISGFLISTSYRDRIADGQIDFLHFMWKRIRKLYPYYVITNIVVILINVLQTGFIQTINVSLFIKMALMLQFGWFGNVEIFNYPTWFVCILMQCYLLYYFFAKQYRKNKDRYFVMAILIPIFGYLMSFNSWNFPFISKANGEGYLCFFVGVLFSELVQLISSLSEERQKKVACYGSLISLAIIAVLCAGTSIYSFSVFAGNILAVNAVIVGPIILFLAIYFRPYGWLLSLKPFYALGKISMAIYFWHAPLMIGFNAIRESSEWLQSIPHSVQSSVFFVFMMLFCIGSYFVFEKRCFHDKT